MVEKGFFQGDPHPGNWYWEARRPMQGAFDLGGSVMAPATHPQIDRSPN